MDKISELGDFFGGESGNVNPLVLILSVLVVVVGAVAVFIFGFKESEPPKIRRRSSDISSKIKKLRKLKRKPEQVPIQKEAEKTTLQQKPVKKEAKVAETSKEASAKPAATTAVVAAKKSGTAVAASSAKAIKNEAKKARGAASMPAKKVSNGKEALHAKSSDKTLDNTVADGGDWQTVTTKKQKKSSTESLNQSSVTVDAAAKVVNSKENVKKGPKNKQAKDKANKNRKATSAGQQNMHEIGTQTTVENVSVDGVGTKVTGTLVAVACQAEVPDALFDRPQNRGNAVKPTTVEAVEVLHAVNSQGTYGAYDELEDPGWTEATAPKKIKKRALRE